MPSFIALNPVGDAARDAATPDPAPTPPREPALEDCCQSGCDPCIFDLYQDALERYRLALQDWQARQDNPGNDKADRGS